MLYSLEGLEPTVDSSSFIAPTAAVIGEVDIEAEVTVWFGCVLRGDMGKITIREGSNIQDGTVIHEETTVGRNCVVGHQALVHRCSVGDGVLIGNGALVFGPCEIGDGAVVAAGAVVVPGTSIAPGEIFKGVPGRAAGQVEERHREQIARTASRYRQSRSRYLKTLKLIG